MNRLCLLLAVAGLTLPALGQADRAVPATTALTHAIRTEDLAAALRNITPELVNQADLGGYHPLTYAAYTGKPELVEALLKGGADPNLTEPDGTTALFAAAQYEQPEMIRALQRHGAKYPAAEVRRQPAAAAVRAEALASLKVLFELYPGIDPAAGWPWPPERRWQVESDQFSPYYARSSLLFATYAGCDGIARELLAHGADPRTASSMRRQPLHFAAGNPRISPELVAGLLSRGADPFADSEALHFSPRTPLDFAAAAGSIEKVRLLTKGQKPREHAAAYRQAAMLAAAAGKRETMDFLFHELGEAPPKLEDVIARAGAPLPTASGADQAMPPLNSIDEPLPPVRPDPQYKPAPAGSLAVIASRSLGNHVAMLTQELSTIEGLTLVERNDLGDVASEKLLQQLAGKDKGPGNLDLTLIPAQQLLFLWDAEVAGRRFIKLSLVSAASRATVMRQVLEFAEPDEAWVKNRLAPLLDAVRLGRHAEQHSTAVSLIPLTPAKRTRECMELVRYANLLLPGQVAREPDVTLLTLRQMQPLETENVLAGNEGSYWKAAWVVEGSLSAEANDDLSLVLAASPPGQKRREDVTVHGRPAELPATLERAWKELAAKLSLKGADLPPAPRLPGEAQEEAKSVAQQSRWFLEAKYPRDAFDLANAAYILGDHDEELLRTMTEAAIDRLPVQRKFGCQHVAKDPRLIDPEVRLAYASSLPDFLALCDCARLYVSGLKQQLVSPYRPAGGGRSPVYNEIVAQALSELHYYRWLMEDCLATARYGRELELLDREIALLTREYLEHCRGHASELDTLRDVLFRRSDGFHARHAPELGKEIAARILELLRQNPANTKATLVMGDLAKWCGNPDRICGADDPFRAFAAQLAGLDGIAGAWPLELAELQAACATESAPRVQALRQMLALSADPARLRGFLSDPRREWERYFDCARIPGLSPLVAEGHLLGPAGIGSLITDPAPGFTATGEFARRAGWYYDLLRWPRTEAAAREKLVLEEIESLLTRPKAERAGPLQLAGIRDFLKAGNMLSPNLARAFAALLPAEAKPGPEEAPLPLAHLLTLPQSAGEAQYARANQAVLDKDELWLPATYFEEGGNVVNVQAPPRCHHVIHVIRLTDRSVRSIELPRGEDPEREGPAPTQTEASDTIGLRPVLLGEQHAYYLKSVSPGILYAIDRRTLQLSQVRLPLPNVIAMAYRTRGDTLYLSVADQTEPLVGRERFGATAVIAVSGAQVSETVVSNQRKPPQMPLDQPDTWVDLIQVADERLVLVSHRDAGYIHPESLKGAARPWQGGDWTSLQAAGIDKVRESWQVAYNGLFRSQRNFSIGPQKVFLTEDPYDGQVPAAIVVARDLAAVIGFRASWALQPTHAGQFRLLPVAAAPLADPQMDRRMFTLDIPKAERTDPAVRYRTMSANEVLRAKEFNVRVFGKWQDQYLVFLAGQGKIPMPAIWTLPAAEFEQRVGSLLPW